MRDTFTERRLGWLYYRADNQRCIAGHVRVLGCMVYRYGEQAPGWAIHRVWNAGLFAVHHIGLGKATDAEGWHVTFARLTFTRQYGGILIRWQKADVYSAKRARP